MSGVCGWAGIARTEGDALATVRRMTAALPEPADMVQHATARAGAGLGCRVHPAEGGFSGRGGVWAAFDGTPRWRDPELAAVARAEGHASALREAWRRYETRLLDHLGGHVAVAVVEPETGRALVAIDRAGVHALTYAQVPGGVAFATTLDAVCAHPAVGQGELALRALHDYLAFTDRIPAPYTALEGVRKLVPGECLVVDAGRVRVRRYWDMPYRPQGEGDAAVLAAELRDTLAAAVGRSLEGEATHRVGAFLSGGLDSSTVAGLFAQAVDHPARAFTVAFEDDRYDESPYARMAAAYFGLNHDVLTVRSDDVAAVIEAIATAYDEPFGNSSAVPAYLCARRAREAGVDMLLAGDGGDELFAGNARYLKDRVFQQYTRLPGTLRRRLVEPVALRLSPESSVTLARKAARYVRKARRSVAARALDDGLFAHLPPDAVLSDDVLAAVDPDAPVRLAEEIWNAPPEADDLQRFMYLDLRLTLADGDLRKVGRMCALAGVRVRYPMLDDDVMAFSARVPPHLLCADGRLRAFYKDAFSGLLPAPIIDKQKHGFGLPYQEFLATDPALRTMACDAITDLKGSGLFRTDFLDGQIAALTGASGAAPPQAVIAWDLVILHRWLTARDGGAQARTHVAGAAE